MTANAIVTESARFMWNSRAKSQPVLPAGGTRCRRGSADYARVDVRNNSLFVRDLSVFSKVLPEVAGGIEPSGRRRHGGRFERRVHRRARGELRGIALVVRGGRGQALPDGQRSEREIERTVAGQVGVDDSGDAYRLAFAVGAARRRQEHADEVRAAW